MPLRFLRPGITTSRRWNSLDWDAQSFYVRLLTVVDDYGRYDGDYELLKAFCFPLRNDVTLRAVANMCVQLQENKLAEFYTDSDGKPYIQLTKWVERARSTSKYPGPSDNNCQQMLADVNKCSPPSPSPSPSPSPKTTPPNPPSGGTRANGKWEPNELHLRLNALFQRKPTTRWSDKELRAFKALEPFDEEELSLVESYYRASIPKDKDHRRHDLGTLLNNFSGEVDRARKFNGSVKEVTAVKKFCENIMSDL